MEEGGVAVGNHGDHAIPEFHAPEVNFKTLCSPLQDTAVAGNADGKPDRPGAFPFSGSRNHLRDGSRMAGDDGLAGGIVAGQGRDMILAVKLAAQRLHLFPGETEDGRHGAFARGHGLRVINRPLVTA